MTNMYNTRSRPNFDQMLQNANVSDTSKTRAVMFYLFSTQLFLPDNSQQELIVE